MRTYTIVVEPDETGDFVVSVPALPGCFTRGKTLEECRQRAAEAIEVHIAGLLADGEPVPEEVGVPQLLTVTVAACVFGSQSRCTTIEPESGTSDVDRFSAPGGTRIPNLLIRSSARGIFPPTPVMTIHYQ